MRRVIDVLVGWCCLVLAAPGMFLIAVLIKRGSPGPIFYIPKMVGRDGMAFPLFRFRTLYVDHADRSGQTDPRTSVGRMLQEYSLDHLPTLFNLLLGHISIVGPRPMELAVVDMRDPIWRSYFQVTPGLFSDAVLKLGKLWTPSRASHPEANQALELDYLQMRSGWGDLRLALRFLTAWATSRGNVKMRKEPDIPLGEHD